MKTSAQVLGLLLGAVLLGGSQCQSKDLATGASCSANSECRSTFCCGDICTATACTVACGARTTACQIDADCCPGLYCVDAACSVPAQCESTTCTNPAMCVDNCNNFGPAATACAQVQCNPDGSGDDTCGNKDSSCPICQPSGSSCASGSDCCSSLACDAGTCVTN